MSNKSINNPRRSDLRNFSDAQLISSLKSQTDISPNTSFKALEEIGRRSAAADLVRRELSERRSETGSETRSESRPKPRKARRVMSPLEQNLATVQRAIKQLPVPEGRYSYVPQKRQSPVSLFEVYIFAQGDSKRRHPEAAFIFYEGGVSTRHIDSVAVYGTGIEMVNAEISARGTAFGLPVKSVKADMGCNEYLDITFRA